MTSGSLKLRFLANDGDEDEGLADAGIETFRDAPFASVARESGQNSRDAAVEFPVALSFNVIDIPVGEFPDYERFQQALTDCKRRAAVTGDIKEKQFFSQAQSLLSQPVLRALQISDEGTTGLMGPCVPGTPFHSLVKASGVSNKNNVASGGSYGIGKKAAFAVSDLHTVFYSTSFRVEHGPTKFLAQGKCTLVSHESDGGAKLRATGYWCTDGYQPEHDIAAVPDWLSRVNIGTTCTAVGFSASETWRYKIAESLIRNFFVAVHRDELWFFIDNGSIEIDSSSIRAFFTDPAIVAAAEEHGKAEELRFSKALYECLTSDLTEVFEETISGLGKFRLHLLLQEGMPSRVAIVRNGMMITDNLGYFGDKLAHFPMYKDFVALVEPAEQESSAAIKRLENPAHDQLSAERLIDKAEQRTIRASMKALREWVRGSIRSRAFSPPTEETVLDEMNEFFGDVSEFDRIPDPKDGETDPGRIIYSSGKPRRPIGRGVAEGDEGEGGAGGANNGQGGTKPGRGSGKGASDGGTGGTEAVGFENLRNIPNPARPSLERTVIFTPLTTCRAKLGVKATGMNQDVLLTGVVVRDPSGNPIREMKLEAGRRERISIEFSQPYSGPISLEVLAAGGGT